MDTGLHKQLTALAAMDREALLVEWPRHCKTPPRSTRRDYLLAEISYHLQARVLGGISTTVKNKLERMAFGGQSQHQGKFTMQQGSRLVREWNGRAHTVIVHADGYEYEGARYRSLSKVATAITGAHWSGPLFFGLKKQKGAHEKAA
jgi:hypothetical protein